MPIPKSRGRFHSYNSISHFYFQYFSQPKKKILLFILLNFHSCSSVCKFNLLFVPLIFHVLIYNSLPRFTFCQFPYGFLLPLTLHFNWLNVFSFKMSLIFDIGVGACFLFSRTFFFFLYVQVCVMKIKNTILIDWYFSYMACSADRHFGYLKVATTSGGHRNKLVKRSTGSYPILNTY